MTAELWIQVFVAIIALFGAYYAANKGSDDKIKDIQRNFQDAMDGKQHNHEEKQLQREIKANLVGSARIEWIQEVRREFTDVISNMNSLTGINDIGFLIEDEQLEKQFDHLLSLDAGLYKLLLYFGNDKVKNTDISFDEREKNEGYNYIIIDRIESLQELIENRRSGLMTIHRKDALFKGKIEEHKASFTNESESIKSFSVFAEAFSKSIDRTVIGDLSKSMAEGVKAAEKLQNWSNFENDIGEDEDKAIEELFTELLSGTHLLKSEDRKIRETTKHFTDDMRDYLKMEWKEVTKNLE